jgi:hypothetical protein
MKKTLLALALLVFTGSAAFATNGDDKKGKKARKKEASTTEAKAASGCQDMGSTATAMPAGCCSKKAAKTTAAAETNVPAPVKSL